MIVYDIFFQSFKSCSNDSKEGFINFTFLSFIYIACLLNLKVSHVCFASLFVQKYNPRSRPRARPRASINVVCSSPNMLEGNQIFTPGVFSASEWRLRNGCHPCSCAVSKQSCI